MVTRRFFIGGAGAFGAFGAFAGNRALVTNLFHPDAKPNLTFGVLSDLHVRAFTSPGKSDTGYGGTETLHHALEWFRDKGADAVVIAGDMADLGMVEQLEAVAKTWQVVFPDNRAPDGRTVEKVFVLGNHDYHGYLYADSAARMYPDRVERTKHVIRADIKGHWERLFKEEYRRFYCKSVNGYRFLGANWDDGTGMETGYGKNTFGIELKAYLDGHGRSLNPRRPFFYVQHQHPKDTCYGKWAWVDDGKTTAALDQYANAVVFSGHSHFSLTDERSVWQGAFTSIGAGSLRYTGTPYNSHPAGYENTLAEGPEAWRFDARKLMRNFVAGDCRQGMLWRVYDDCMVGERHEFVADVSLGPDWVIPLAAAEDRPFSYAVRMQKFSAPQFASDAKLSVRPVTLKNRGGRSPDGKTLVPVTEQESLIVTIPPPLLQPNARVFEYEVSAESKDGVVQVKNVMAEGFNHALIHEKARSVTSCPFAREELGRVPVRFVVTPVNSFGQRGNPLVSDYCTSFAAKESGLR